MRLLRTSWRNLWRNRRRTLLAASAIGLGLVALVAMVSFLLGLHETIVRQIAHSSLGHLQLGPADPAGPGRLIPLPASRLLAQVTRTPGVEAASGRLVFSGSIRSSRVPAVQVVQIWGVDPAREAPFSVLARRVVAGGFVVPPPGSRRPGVPERLRQQEGILLGRKLARLLQVELGSRVRLDLGRGRDGETTAGAFVVTGLVETGAASFDRQLVLVELAGLQRLSGVGDRVHEVTLLAAEPAGLPTLVEALRALLPAEVRVRPWWEIRPEIKQMLEITRSWTVFLYVLMLALLSAGILTTLAMVVRERRREFGVQLALGTSRGRLFAGILLESILLALLATGGGLLLSVGVVAFLAGHGIDLSWLIGGFDFAGLFLENVYRGSASPRVFGEPALAVLVGTVLLAVWPAWQAARLRIVDALRAPRGPS
ncbi:MAG: ABC transporter permease [Myxococcota bacterium]|jgi:ABC-type lipoprotein release transport system permease subunit|nr:ABC transporter permease [Myxococcota bacterium]